MRLIVKTNYQLELDKVLKNLNGRKPKLLIHSCCAPCSSYVLEYLNVYFDITILYYNPNIYPETEFYKRVAEQEKLVNAMGLSSEIINIGYNSNEFYSAVKGLEKEPEGGRRCEKCFYLRLDKTAQIVKERGFDYFTTTLSVSPLKNEQILNQIGKQLSEKYDIPYLYSDFKKKNGYKRTIELSKKYELYRQNYCGCIFSQNA